MRSTFLCFGLCLLISDAAVAQAAEPSIWCSDDVGRRIYHVSMDGSFVHSSFYSGSISGLAVDPTDGTIWAAKEGSARIMHFDRLGNRLAVMDTAVFDAAATGPEGVTVDYFDDTLWIVDDDTARVYNVTKHGALLTSFSSTVFHPNATSPQAIAADPVDGTLWLTENRTDAIYNVSVTGALLSTFTAASFSPAATNCQGINVDESDGTLWVTDRTSHSVYHLERDGTLISSFDTEFFGSLDPTGVVYDSFPLNFVPDLERAGIYGVFGSERVKFRGPNPEVFGHVALAPGAKQAFDKGFIDGTLYVDPTADNTHVHNVVIAEGTVIEDLSLAADELMDAADAFAALPATQTFDRINSTTTIEGGAGLNVIKVGNIILKGDESLTLTGGVHTRFVINVQSMVRLMGDSMIIVGGDVDPRNVVFNMLGKRGVTLGGDAWATGTFISANGGNVTVQQDAQLHGSVLATSNVAVLKNGRIVFFGK